MNKRLHEDMHTTFPTDKIACRDCRYRMRGIIGYKNSYCAQYPDGDGKPFEVLFQNAGCEVKERENV